MAAGDPYAGCSNPTIGVLELLNAVSTQVTSTGRRGVRVYRTSVAHALLSSPIGCSSPLEDFEQWLRSHIVLDSDGKPAIALIEAT